MGSVDAVAGTFLGVAKHFCVRSPSSIKLAEELMCKEVECAAGAVSQVMVLGAETSSKSWSPICGLA